MDNLSNASLANRFNLCHPNQPVSSQAFYHWLIGCSIPTADKIDTLAKWFNTSPQWLRYGRSDQETTTQGQQELLLLSYFCTLNPLQQQALLSLLHSFNDTLARTVTDLDKDK